MREKQYDVMLSNIMSDDFNYCKIPKLLHEPENLALTFDIRPLLQELKLTEVKCALLILCYLTRPQM